MYRAVRKTENCTRKVTTGTQVLAKLATVHEGE